MRLGHGDGLEGGLGGFLATLLILCAVFDLPPGFGGRQGAKWRAQAVPGDLVAVDEQMGESGLVEASTDTIAGLEVELGELGQEVHAGLQDCRSVSDLFGALFQQRLELSLLPLHVPQPLLDFILGEGAIGREVDEVLLLGRQSRQLLGDLPVLEPDGLLAAGQGLGHGAAELSQEFRRKPELLVVLFDGLLDAFKVAVRRGAAAVLGAGTKEVVACRV